MRPTSLVLIAGLLLTLPALAQKPTAPAAPTTAAEFHGATADLAHYKAVYQVNFDDDKHIRGALKNIENALTDPRLSGKLEVELVVHGAGVVLMRKDQPYEELLRDLQQKGVLLTQCENTMRERKITKEELWPFISYVPSGNGEIIIRQQQGWAIVHP